MNENEHDPQPQQTFPNAGEREFETGKDESWASSQHSQNEAWFANVKRTYDEFLHESLESIRSNRLVTSKLMSDAQQYDNQRQVIANQSLQNAIETANMVGKQTVRHADIAVDRQWNVDEQGFQVTEILRDQTFKDAIAAAVANMVNNTTPSA